MQTTDYLIARHPLRLEGAALHRHLRQLPGFQPFLLPSASAATPLLTFRWDEETPNLPYKTDRAVKLYEIEAEGVRIFLFRDNDRTVYHFKMEDAVRRFTFSYELGAGEMEAQGQATPDMLRFALWMAYGLATAPHQTIAIHSSAICYQGKTVLFLGESGTGKSTHTRLWREHIEGATLLNDDSPVIRITDGLPTAYGSPWSGKTPCYKAESYPLAGLVRLSQAPYNRIRRLSTLEAFGAVYPSYPPAFAPDTVLSDAICATLSALLSSIPVYALECLPNREAALLSCRTLFG